MSENPDLHRDSAVRREQEEGFVYWLSGDEAIKLIGGEDRNHMDTAQAAFLAGWKAAIRFVFSPTAPKAGNG